MPFVSVPEAIEEIRAGRILVVVDDEDRENEGDLTIAAEKVTPEIINFMATHGRGLICLTLTPERCDYLRLPLMSPTNTSNFGTAFCESIDAREGVTTGISAADRTRTILTAIDPQCRPADLARPGHVFPLRAREGGVLVRAGQTEAAVDLARLAGLTPAGVICEIMNEDGTMARVPQLEEFCARHGLKMISVAELIRYRLKHEKFVRRAAEGCIETEFGEFRTVAYASDLNPEYHLALVRGDVAGREGVLVRMHSRCLYGDVFGSTACDCHRLIRGFPARHRRRGYRGAGLPARDRSWIPHRTRPFGSAAYGLARPRFHALQRRGRPAAAPARARHRRPDPLRPGPPHHPAAHQPSPQNRGTGRVWHRNCGPDPGRPLNCELPRPGLR